MDDLLTARQVQELLKVDRTTVYRMLKDGRLSGIKIGKNWRFLRKNIDVLLQEQSHQEKTTLIKAKIFPGHCIQGLQDIFSEVAGVSCVAVDSEATFLTQASNPSPFCQKIQSTPEGRAACRQSWKKIIKSKRNHAPFHVCHAGLNYTVACIRMANQIESYILCGQFVESAEQKKALQASIPQVAQKLGLKEKDLRQLEDQVYLLSPRVRKNLKLWLERLAQSLIDLTSERNDLVNRLHKIHQLSAFQEE
ncbi:PocR ligand-binding domain-containing protein [Calditrichota bacterium LG25]